MSLLRTASFAALALTAACFAPQEPAPTDPACPHLQIQTSESVPAGKHARVGVTLIGPRAGITLTWSVTDGTIVSGQGTDSILIDTSQLAGKTLRADVELGGLAPTCMSRGASTFVLVGPAVSTSSR